MTLAEALARLADLEQTGQIHAVARETAAALIQDPWLAEKMPSEIAPEYGAVRLTWGGRRFRVTPVGGVHDMVHPDAAARAESRDAAYVAGLV